MCVDEVDLILSQVKGLSFSSPTFFCCWFASIVYFLYGSFLEKPAVLNSMLSIELLRQIKWRKKKKYTDLHEREMLSQVGTLLLLNCAHCAQVTDVHQYDLNASFVRFDRGHKYKIYKYILSILFSFIFFFFLSSHILFFFSF